MSDKWPNHCDERMTWDPVGGAYWCRCGHVESLVVVPYIWPVASGGSGGGGGGFAGHMGAVGRGTSGRLVAATAVRTAGGPAPSDMRPTASERCAEAMQAFVGRTIVAVVYRDPRNEGWGDGIIIRFDDGSSVDLFGEYDEGVTARPH
jgi:hypothetical protein